MRMCLSTGRLGAARSSGPASLGGLMPSWLIILLVGVVLLVLGFAGVAKFLIYVGIAVLLVSLILGFLGGRSSKR